MANPDKSPDYYCRILADRFSGSNMAGFIPRGSITDVDQKPSCAACYRLCGPGGFEKIGLSGIIFFVPDSPPERKNSNVYEH